MDIMATYKQWKTGYYFDKKTRDELTAIENDPEAIRDRFYRELDFGTAGIRGVIGAGTNRINLYVVRKVSHAVATYISNLGAQARQAGVVIGYDSRNFSKEFAMEAASIFAGYEIKTLMHPEICPVPVLSYSITKFKCAAGVMITASHNPKQYNGYKVYGSDGAQLGPDACKAISDIMNGFEDYSKLATFSFDYLKQGNKIKILDGYPRTIVQFWNVCETVEKLPHDIVSIKRNTSIELIKERVSKRRVCKDCKTTHSVDDGCCPKCGGVSEIRKDDAVIDNRLAEYHRETEALWDDIMAVSVASLTVDGSRDAHEVAEEFVKILL